MPDNRLPAAGVQSAIYQALDLVNARQVREFSVPPTTLIGPAPSAAAGMFLRSAELSTFLLWWTACCYRPVLPMCWSVI